MSGKLIVIEGTDGSGKATQTQLLCDRLAREGIEYRRLSFPRYGEKSATLVQMYLDGVFGSAPGDVNAYAASAFFAVDRYASYKEDWGRFYEAGGLIVADRYVTSNAVHQASKLPESERAAFVDWLFHFEYDLLGLARPTEVFYLDVPTELTEKLLRAREKSTNTSADIHEQDAAYLAHCRANGRWMMEYCAWRGVDCAREGRLRDAQDIHEEIYGAVKALL